MTSLGDQKGEYRGKKERRRSGGERQGEKERESGERESGGRETLIKRERERSGGGGEIDKGGNSCREREG